MAAASTTATASVADHDAIAQADHTVRVVIEKMRGFNVAQKMLYAEVAVAGETKRAVSLMPPSTSEALRALQPSARRGAAVAFASTHEFSHAFNQEFHFTVRDAAQRQLMITVKDLEKSHNTIISDSKVPLASCEPGLPKRGWFRTYFPKGGAPAGELLLSVTLLNDAQAQVQGLSMSKLAHKRSDEGTDVRTVETAFE